MSPNYMLCAWCIHLQKTSFNPHNNLILSGQYLPHLIKLRPSVSELGREEPEFGPWSL